MRNPQIYPLYRREFTSTEVVGPLVVSGGGDITIKNPAGTTRITIGGGTNDIGIVFGNLGTANFMIDGSNSGMGGVGDYWLYLDANNYWRADGHFTTTLFADMVWGNRTTIRSNSVAVPFGFEARDNQTFGLDCDTGANAAILVGNLSTVGLWAGDGVSNGTAVITDVGGAAHGLSLAVGDLVHIRDATTGSDEGFYRVANDDGTNITLDRSLTGSDTNLSVTFYKDIVGIFPTDGTNGQRITNYSHQDKPLQIGGDTLLTAHSDLGSEDVVIGGIAELMGIPHLSAGAGTVKIFSHQEDSLADDGTVSLPDATSGFVLVSCNAECGLWLVQNDGSSSKVVGTANTANTDSDTDLCVYDGGSTQAIAKNRLGATGEIRIIYFYE